MAKPKSKTISVNKLPQKRTINLATAGRKHFPVMAAIPSVLAIVLVAAAFSKFAVADRYAAAWQAEAQTAQLQAQVDDAYARIDEYGELTDLYAHYTYSGFTDEEKARTDRIAVADMLQTVLFSRSGVTSWSISGNRLSVSITAGSLQEINQLVAELEGYTNLVEYCEVSTAATGSRQTDAMGYDTVVGQVTVHLLANSEEAGY